MRSSASICLAESAILKEFIRVAYNLNEETHPDYIAISEKLPSAQAPSTEYCVPDGKRSS